MHTELPVAAFIAAGLVLVPLPWHWRARNIATVSIIVWLFVSNIIYAINSIIWAGNVAASALVWCDISKFDVFCALYCFSRTSSNKATNWSQHGSTCMLSMYMHSSRANRLRSSSAHLPFGQGPVHDFRCCALLGDAHGLHDTSCVDFLFSMNSMHSCPMQIMSSKVTGLISSKTSVVGLRFMCPSRQSF